MYIDWIIFSIEQITFVVYLIHHKESLVNTKITICNAFLNQITTFDHLQTDSKTAEKKQPSKLIIFVRSSITSVPIATKVLLWIFSFTLYILSSHEFSKQYPQHLFHLN